jgi:mannose-6-phosphate isomerase-like protein (cupin superfamily)
MNDYPRTIDNGAGEELTFLGVRSDERGEYLEARNSVSPGSGPPMHVHYLQEESLVVERGTMGWQRRGEKEQVAGQGETATFAPGEMHRFWNAGEDELVCTGYVRPPDNLEYFLTQIFASTRANGGKRPRLFDAAYLLSRYRSEFGMADIPAPVQRFVFPVVVAIGRLLGRDRRFAGAPEPVSRTRPVGGARA